MAVYRGKYVLQGLGSISPEMERNLDVAYGLCMSYKEEFPCEMCGRCCHQPNIVVRPEEVDRISAAAGVPLHEFVRDYLVRTDDGRLLFKKTKPCAFLGEDNRCSIWESRPQICDDFPYAVSMFMSRVYLALTNPDADVLDLISYMDDGWPCTRVIKRDIKERVEAARKDVVLRVANSINAPGYAAGMPAQPKRILLVVMEGMGDRACPDLRGLTPLQYVRTANLDWLVAHGTSGVCDAVSPGVRTGSAEAHLALLGYDPRATGEPRGPFEALGAGLDLEPGDVAFRCNVASVNADGEVLSRRSGRIGNEEASRLVEAMDGLEIDGVECVVAHSSEHRAALVLRGDGLSPDVTDCDPGQDAVVRKCEPLSPGAERTASVVNGFMAESYRRLGPHEVNAGRMASGRLPANLLLPRGAGTLPSIEPFPERTGLRSACVAGIGMVKGLCRACGIDVLPLPGACDGSCGSDLVLKAEAALDALEGYDFVMMDVKAADVASHDGDAKAKAEVVKRVDRAFDVIRSGLPRDVVVAVACDHCTPCVSMDHTGDPFPVCFYTEGMAWDDATEFSETGCARGMLGRIRSRDVVPICMDLADRPVRLGRRRA